MNAAVEPTPPPEPDDWASREHVHSLVMFAITLIAIYLCYRMTVPFLSSLAWALALTVLVLPFYRLLGTRLRRPGLVAAISVLAAAVTVVAPIVLLTASVIDEAAGGAAAIQASVETGDWRSLFEPFPRMAPAVSWVDQHFDVTDTIKSAASNLASIAAGFVRGSLQQVVMLVLTFYFLFYFLRDRESMLQSTRHLSPLSRAQMQLLFQRVGDTLHATIYGTFIVAIVQGALGGLMFWWLELPAPLLWGVVMGLLAIVPVLGAFVIWIPAALFLLAQGEAGKALLLAAWGTLVVGTIDNLLYPILVGNRMHLHTVLVFIAIVGGLFVFGAAGLILGPVVLTVTSVLLEIWRHPGEDPKRVPATPDEPVQTPVVKAEAAAR